MNLPRAIKDLADNLAELPSIGPRQAIRLAFYLVNRGKEDIKTLASDIAELGGIKVCERCFFVHQNKDSLCDICKNPARRKNVIMIVEKETDLISLENTGRFMGRYFILGNIPKTGLLEDWQKLRLKSLESFIKKECFAPSTGSGQGHSTSPGQGHSTSPGQGHSTSPGQGPSTSPGQDPSTSRWQGHSTGSEQDHSTSPGQAEEIILAFNPSSVGDFHASFVAKELQPFAKKISRLGRGLPTGGEIEFADDETLGSALERRS